MKILIALILITTGSQDYENEVHRDFCQIAESREASTEYLKSNDCI